MPKPKAVVEVEESAPTAVDEAWKRLESMAPVEPETDYPLLIEAGRRDRERWMISQRKKGKDVA